VPGVSAVVVNWNGGATVVDTVASLLQHPPAGDFEVVVVDNASTDGSPDRIASSFPAVRLIRNADNRGLAAANNQGIAAARHDRVLICNPDILVGDGAIDALAGCLDRHERAAWAVPRLRRPDGTLQTAVGDLPTLTEALLGRAGRGRRRFWWDGFGHDEEVPVGHAMECCYLVRREAIDDIGGQDARYFLDWEGIDWARRAADAGWEIWFCPDAEVVHLGGVTLRQVPLRWVRGSHAGMYRYFAARSSPLARVPLAVVITARGVVKAAAVAVGAWRYRHD
jgi:N-acetylglucosaminyl-diphospho-decaprenol L-rhamnosyltransferase